MIVKENEAKLLKIVFEDMAMTSLKLIIDYIYSGWNNSVISSNDYNDYNDSFLSGPKFLGKIDLTFDNLDNVLKDAEKLKVESLVSECKSFLNQETTPSNCIDLFLCGQKVGRKDLETNARDYFLVS